MSTQHSCGTSGGCSSGSGACPSLKWTSGRCHGEQTSGRCDGARHLQQHQWQHTFGMYPHCFRTPSAASVRSACHCAARPSKRGHSFSAPAGIGGVSEVFLLEVTCAYLPRCLDRHSFSKWWMDTPEKPSQQKEKPRIIVLIAENIQSNSDQLTHQKQHVQ